MLHELGRGVRVHDRTHKREKRNVQLVPNVRQVKAQPILMNLDALEEEQHDAKTWVTRTAALVTDQ